MSDNIYIATSDNYAEIRTEVEHVVWQLAGHAGGAMPDE